MRQAERERQKACEQRHVGSPVTERRLLRCIERVLSSPWGRDVKAFLETLREKVGEDSVSLHIFIFTFS